MSKTAQKINDYFDGTAITKEELSKHRKLVRRVRGNTGCMLKREVIKIKRELG